MRTHFPPEFVFQFNPQHTRVGMVGRRDELQEQQEATTRSEKEKQTGVGIVTFCD